MTEAIEAQLEKANGIVEEAKAKLQAGDEVDLSGLDQLVAEVCQQITQLPEEKAAEFAGRLQELMESLNQIAALLQQQQQQVRQQLEGLNKQKQAARAYGGTGVLAANEAKDDSK